MKFTTNVNRASANSIPVSGNERRTRTIVLKCGEPLWLVTRTERAVAALGLPCQTVAPRDLSSAIAEADAVWILQAGTISGRFPPITIRSRRAPLTLIAPKIPGTKQEILAQKDAIHASNGLFTEAQLPHIDVCGCCIERAGDKILRNLDADVKIFADLMRCIIGQCRVVIATGLSLHWTDRLGVIIAISSMHQGGAEKIAAALSQGLADYNVETRLAAFSRPSRESLVIPPNSFLFYEQLKDRPLDVHYLSRIMVPWGPDLIHAHLLGCREQSILRSLHI